jgi:UDP-N-acetylmuramate--alanine ligase
MSAVASILKSEGNEVSGSDQSKSHIIESLENQQIPVSLQQSAENISNDHDLIIYSEAIPQDHPERVKGRELGIDSINYAHALGMISKNKRTIAITGTHGKTTVTGMLTSVLLAAQQDPTIVIGSTMEALQGKNFRVGRSEWFLTEACEYRENFLPLSPEIVLINNLEPDHLDYFKTEENYYDAYQQLIEKIPDHGWLILFQEDAKHLDLTKVSAKVSQISEEECGRELYALKVPGKHNQRNALAAAKVAEKMNIPQEILRSGLENFHGTWRRFEYKGELNGAKLYDDYGHHPTEIKATLQAAREWYPDKQLTVIFQPHQYSRTREFFDQFSTAFNDASEAWITDIYEARDSEEDKAATSAQQLADAITGSSARYVALKDLAQEIKNQADPYRVFLVMGAGNVTKVFSELERKKSS